MEQFNRFVIHLWLAISLATLVWAFFRVYQSGWDEAKENFVIPGIAFSWYLFRRAMYKRMKRNQSQNQP